MSSQWYLLGNDVCNLGCLQVITGNAAVLPWCPYPDLFQFGPDQTLSHECLSQNVKVMTYVAMLALCVFVWYVSCHCIILVCMCAMFQQAYRTKAPLRINEVLTPRACLTLLAYTLILEEPYSVHPFFVFTLPALLVKSVIDHSIIDLALGTSREFSIG